MSDEDVLAAIRTNHLKANIASYEAGQEGAVVRWEDAWLDPGGTIFGPGPYAKVPIDFGDPGWNIVIRVYPPERLRERLAARWRPIRPVQAEDASQ